MTKQQVIDILEAYKPSGNIYNGYNSIEEKIDERICYLIDEIIESVKREPDDDSEWIKCSERMPENGLTMDDLISRQAAIALAYFHGKTATWDNPTPDGVNAVDVADLEELPAVQIELRHGYWIADNARPKSILYRCSVCREIAHDRPYGSLKREPKKTCKMKYCPHCGAKMESEEIK